MPGSFTPLRPILQKQQFSGARIWGGEDVLAEPVSFGPWQLEHERPLVHTSVNQAAELDEHWGSAGFFFSLLFSVESCILAQLSAAPRLRC